MEKKWLGFVMVKGSMSNLSETEGISTVGLFCIQMFQTERAVPTSPNKATSEPVIHFALCHKPRRGDVVEVDARCDFCWLAPFGVSAALTFFFLCFFTENAVATPCSGTRTPL